LGSPAFSLAVLQPDSSANTAHFAGLRLASKSASGPKTAFGIAGRLAGYRVLLTTAT
jgi:hypothetical protein